MCNPVAWWRGCTRRCYFVFLQSPAGGSDSPPPPRRSHVSGVNQTSLQDGKVMFRKGFPVASPPSSTKEANRVLWRCMYERLTDVSNFVHAVKSCLLSKTKGRTGTGFISLVISIIVTFERNGRVTLPYLHWVIHRQPAEEVLWMRDFSVKRVFFFRCKIYVKCH